jgi:hypothetical protein
MSHETDALWGDGPPHRRNKRPPRLSRSAPPHREPGDTAGAGVVDVPNPTTIAGAHRAIARAAAELANQDPRLPGLVGLAGGEVFSEASHGRMGGLTIEYPPLLGEGKDDDWRAAMSEIGRDAFLKVLSAHRGLIVGLVLGEARHGRNYFHGF